MNDVFRQKILDDYKIDSSWNRILNVLDIENDVNLSFERKNQKLIFRVDDFIGDHVFIFRRLCISNAVVKDVLEIVHDDSNDHLEYAKCYEQIVSTWYIRDLTRQLRDYLKYCSKCQINRIRRHQSHDSLQFILSSIIFFHTFNLNFIFALSISRVEQFNVVMSITCKFTKRVIIVLDKNIWTVAQWDRVLLNQLDLDDWKLSKMLIFDRDRKFMKNFWREIFTRFDVKLLYNTVYHSQIDEQSKRTNQTIEIVLRFFINVLNNSADWIEIIFDIQRDINNSIVIAIDKTFNEISYEFIFTQIFDLLKFFEKSSLSLSQMIRQKIVDVLIFAQMNFKFYYDRKHQSINFVVDDWTQIRFHKNYDIFSIAMLNNKFNQQYIVFFRVTKKIDKLIYRLNIFKKWIIHSIFFIVQLKSCFDSIKNFFRRHRFTQSNFVFVEEDIDLIKFFELKRIINKRMIARREVEYLVRWKNYDSEYDVWKNLSKLNDVMNLMQKYENSIRHMIDLFDRHRLSKSIMLRKSFANQTKAIFVDIKSTIRKFFAEQNKAIFVTISSSTFAFQFLVVVSRKSFSISSTSTSLIFSFEALVLRRSNRLAKNWKIFEEELLLEKTHDYELIEIKNLLRHD